VVVLVVVVELDMVVEDDEVVDVLLLRLEEVVVKLVEVAVTEVTLVLE